MDDVNLLYRELLIDYAKMIKYTGKLENANISYTGTNPACGDEIYIEGYIDENNKLQNIKVNTKGCFISKASTNLMAEILQGKSINRIYELIDDYKKYITLKKEKLEKEENKELEILDGVRKFPTRIKCALIGWESLLEALKKWDIKKEKI